MTAENRPRGSWLLGDDMTGRTSGDLVVIARAERPEGASPKIHGTWWLCRCECGNTKVLPRCWLINQHTKSCGCRKRGPKGSACLDPMEQKTRKVRKSVKEKDDSKQMVRIASSCEMLAYECVCPVCKKTFERLSSEWVYKATIRSRLYWFCSWKCMRKATFKQQGLKAIEV